MKPLIAKQWFSEENGDRVFVRGTFSQWQGNRFELLPINKSGIYSGSYHLDVSVSDTLQFKYIIQRSDERLYWEPNPNPQNKDHGNRILIVTSDQMELPVTQFNYDEYIRYPVIFSRDKLLEDFKQMRHVVETMHPALYDYTDKATLDSLFDYSEKKIISEMEFSQFYKLASSVLERIGCGHTKLWVPGQYWNVAPDRLLPFRILINSKGIYLRDYYEDFDPIPIGSKIISINQTNIRKIIETLKSITSSDGFIGAFKKNIVEKHFARRYALYFGFPDRYKVQYIAPGDSIQKLTFLHPSTIAAVKNTPVKGNDLRLQLLDDDRIALLTINTFAYYEQVDMFQSFIDSCFAVIADKKIDHLILDLRGNDGGDPFCSSYLLRYLQPHPVPYFAGSHRKYNPLTKPLPLAENHFTGHLYTLIDDGTFSTTGHFLGLLKYHRIGKLIGSESGATFTCTGSVHYENLKHTHLILGTARKRRYTVVVENMDPMRGIIPDYFVEQTRQDLIEGKDTVLNFTLSMIHQQWIESDYGSSTE